MCHVRMRYDIKVINVGGFNIDDLEPDRQSAKKFSSYVYGTKLRKFSSYVYGTKLRKLGCGLALSSPSRLWLCGSRE